jgi:hypothetical protein
MGDGSDGVIDCASTCVLDDRTSGFCDEDFSCAEGDWDDGECETEGCGLIDLGTTVGDEVAAGVADSTWESIYDSDCGDAGGIETSFLWTPPSAGYYCIDTWGSGFNTVLSIMDSTCSTVHTCDDDGRYFPTPMPRDGTSKLVFVASDTDPIVIILNGYSRMHSPIRSSYILNITPGGCSLLMRKCRERSAPS